MRKSSSLSSPLLLLCLLTARCCHGVEVGSFGTRVGGGPAGRRCAGRYVTVADTTSFPIAGCYRRTSNHDHGNAFSYANYEEKVVEGVASQPMVMWNSHVSFSEQIFSFSAVSLTSALFALQQQIAYRAPEFCFSLRSKKDVLACDRGGLLFCVAVMVAGYATVASRGEGCRSWKPERGV